MTTTYFLNCIMGNVFQTETDPALPTAVYLGLSTTEPSIDGTGVSEPSSNVGYERVQLTTLSEPSDGVVTNSSDISFVESIGDWGTVAYFVIYDAETDGNLLMYEALSTSRSVEEGTIVTVKSGGLNLVLSNS